MALGLQLGLAGGGDGAILNGMWFDGVNDDVTFPDTAALSFGNAADDLPFSVFARVYMTSFGAPNPIVSKAVNTTAGNCEWLIYVDTAGRLSISIYDNTTSNQIYRAQTTSLAVNTEYMVGFTYDGNRVNGGIKVYVNGLIVASTGGFAGTYVAMHSTPTVISLGSYMRSNAAVDAWMSGVIRQAFISSTELSAAEVLALYNGTIPASAVLNAPGTGILASDWTNGANTATVNGSPKQAISNDGGINWSEVP